jgi:hypothetical protein
MRRAAAFLSTLTLASSAFAQEPVGAPAAGDRFAAPNGELGAGLSISKQGTARAFGELGFHMGSMFGVVDVTSLSWLLGGGYKITPSLELDLMLPMAFLSGSGGGESDSGLGVGNLHIGAHFMQSKDELRYKVGGALEWGPWNSDYDAAAQYAIFYGAGTRGAQNTGLWASETLTVLTPARIEYGHQLSFTGDGALGFHVPTDGGDFDFSVLLAPGVAYYVSETVLLGARLPMVFVLTNDADMAQLGFEPNARFDLGTAFVNARFTLNIDEPLGFSFDEGGIWGLHVGAGGTF